METIRKASAVIISLTTRLQPVSLSLVALFFPATCFNSLLFPAPFELKEKKRHNLQMAQILSRLVVIPKSLFVCCCCCCTVKTDEDEDDDEMKNCS